MFELTDLGLTEPLRPNRPAQELIGTLTTFPPEMVPMRANSIYDYRDDIWAIGVLTYGILTCSDLFLVLDSHKRPDFAKTISNISHIKLNFAGRLSESAEKFVRRILRKIDARPQTAIELLEDAWLDDIRGVTLTPEMSPWVDIGEKRDVEIARKTLAQIREKSAAKTKP